MRKVTGRVLATTRKKKDNVAFQPVAFTDQGFLIDNPDQWRHKDLPKLLMQGGNFSYLEKGISVSLSLFCYNIRG